MEASPNCLRLKNRCGVYALRVHVPHDIRGSRSCHAGTEAEPQRVDAPNGDGARSGEMDRTLESILRQLVTVSDSSFMLEHSVEKMEAAVRRQDERIGGADQEAARNIEVIGSLSKRSSALSQGARAGSAGKGFSVVAKEVQGLAGRAAGAVGGLDRLAPRRPAR